MTSGNGVPAQTMKTDEAKAREKVDLPVGAPDQNVGHELHLTTAVEIKPGWEASGLLRHQRFAQMGTE